MSTFNKDLENRPVKRIPVSVSDLRSLRLLVERASRVIHSNGHMVRQDKLAALTPLAQAKKSLDGILQLDLFTADQLEQ